jgi:predicted DNA-binding protein
VTASPAASLHTGLLASKGHAQPTRSVSLPGSDSPVREIATARARPANPVHQNRITVRLDDKQRLRLRLASAHLGKARQTLLIEALDHYLNQVMPTYLQDHCPCIEDGVSTADRCVHGNKS